MENQKPDLTIEQELEIHRRIQREILRVHKMNAPVFECAVCHKKYKRFRRKEHEQTNYHLKAVQREQVAEVNKV